jgi:nicotinic acid mononucleotide adenylyltransferase
MMEVFYQELFNEWYAVRFSDHYLKNKQQGLTTTIWMDQHYSREIEGALYHIFGVDVIPQIPNWSWNENWFVQKQLKKIFIPRKWFVLPDPIPLENYHILEIDLPNISSTMVREAIKTKQAVSHLLTPQVEAFIRENSLYS